MQFEKEILSKLNRIEYLLSKKESKPLKLEEAAEFLGISTSYLYKLTSSKMVPCHQPNGKQYFFYEDELNNWIRNKQVQSSKFKGKSTIDKAGRRKSNVESQSSDISAESIGEIGLAYSSDLDETEEEESTDDVEPP